MSMMCDQYDDNQYGHYTVKAGLARRTEFRRLLLRKGLDFTEDKGFFDSQFTIYGEFWELKAIERIVNQIGKEK